jgi:hypothetical protein
MYEAVFVHKIGRSEGRLTMTKPPEITTTVFMVHDQESNARLYSVYSEGFLKKVVGGRGYRVWFSVFGCSWSRIFFYRIPFPGGIVRIGMYPSVGPHSEHVTTGRSLLDEQVRKRENDSTRARWKDN